MKTLTIQLKDDNINNIGYVLGEISKAIDDGFNSGIEYPVNWQLKSEQESTMDFMNGD